METRPITVEFPVRWLRLAGSPFVYYPVTFFTGVSVTFMPLFLYRLGRAGTELSDWRVLACFAVVFLVPLVYFRLGTPVLRWAREQRDVGARHE